MQNVLLALLLVALNIDLFLLLNVNFNINVPVSRKALKILLLPIVAVIVMLVILNPDKYLGPCFLSAAVLGLMLVRLFIYRIMAVNFENDIELNRSIRKFFDMIVYPFFVIFISLYQCLYIFVWSY